MTLIKKLTFLFLKKFFIFTIFVFFINSFFVSSLHAESITKNFTAVSGEDTTTGLAISFSQSDINNLSTIDQNRIRNNSDTWPIGTGYDENKYLEFVFNGDIPEGAEIESVIITNNFRRSGALTATKLEVWDGNSFINQEIFKCQNTTTDCQEDVDVTSYINNPDLINNIKIRFLAYRDEGGNTKTSHDFIGLGVVYSDSSGGGGEKYTEIIEDITENTIWTKENSPYLINESISVYPDVNLTIEAGVVVKYGTGASLEIFGSLDVLGEAEDKVYFSKQEEEKNNKYLSFYSSNLESNINNLVISDIYIDSSEGSNTNIDNLESNRDIWIYDSSSLNIDNSSFAGFDLFEGSSAKVDNSHFKYVNLFQSSSAEISNSFINNDDDHDHAVGVFESSNIDLINVKIEDINGAGIGVYEDSSVSFLDSEINLSGGVYYDTLEVFGSNLEMKNSSVSCNHISKWYSLSCLSISDESSFETEDEGFALLENVDIDSLENGIGVYNSSLAFIGGNVNALNNGIAIYHYGEEKNIINIKEIIVSGALDAGFLIYSNNGSDIDINKNEVTGNYYGFKVFGPSLSVNENSIHDNLAYGAYTPPVEYMDFRNNYWGDETGPTHITNIEGIGDAVSDHIIFEPWLLKWPAKEECKENCFSNVMFFPGVEGSRIYGEILKCGEDITGELCGEREFWVSRDRLYHEQLFLDSFGKSIKDVYTKNDTEKLHSDDGETGIVDEILGINIYKSFISDLQKWKEEEEIINDYALVPYDWRLALEDIVQNGRVVDDNISYTGEQDFSESFILNKLRDLAESSKSGKVTLIAHSTGGLVIKTLMNKLKENNDPLYEKIDKIIFVAVPEVGTPEATIALLHGVPLGKGFILPTDRSRQLSENMSTIYNLAPSEEYFNTVDTAINPIITFENKPLLKDKIERYGIYINTALELKDFVLGGDMREKPEVEDTKKPNVGNLYLYEKGENIHKIIDNWQPGENTKIIEIAGWGEETKAGLDYVVKKKFLGEEYVSYKPRIVVDGDATVIFPSALWMENGENVEEWVVNLEKYNSILFILTNGNLARNHKNLLEIDNLRNFIKSKIMNTDFSDSENIVLKNELELVSRQERLHFTLHSPLYLGIFDSEGRYTGIDPLTKEIKREIPDVDFEQIGDVQFISIKLGIPYTLKMEGYEEGSFTLDIDKQIGNEIVESVSFEGIKNYINTFATLEIIPDFKIGEVKLQIDYDNDKKIDDILTQTSSDALPKEEPKTTYGSYILPRVEAKGIQNQIIINNEVGEGRIVNNFEPVNGTKNEIKTGKIFGVEEGGEVLGIEDENEDSILVKEPAKKDNKVIIYVILLISLIAGVLIRMVKEF